MKIEFKVDRAFSKLAFELLQFKNRFYNPAKLKTFGLNDETINDKKNLLMILEYARTVLEYMKKKYRAYDIYEGYNFLKHADVMQEQFDILEPVANKMVEDEEMDISEILTQMTKPKVLPDGIDYKKYDGIFGQLKLPSVMFDYIFVCENILRKFIIQVLEANGYPSIDSIGNKKLNKSITDKKNKEAKQNYLPIRGDHDIYYLNLIELNNIIINLWNECFKDKFERQNWICERIESLYAIRNRVAHSSGYLRSDELRSVETRCREIIMLIDQYIK